MAASRRRLRAGVPFQPGKTAMKIVIAIDGSSAALNALEHLIRLAKGWGGSHQLALVNVQQPIVHADAFGLTAGMDGPLLQQLGERDLAAAVEMAKASGFAVEQRIEVGPPAGCIADYAKDVGADLIVLGTKGRSNLANVLVGSVANRLPQQAKLPVLLIPPKD
jgi:nucleotide-binding universal stress UspA family protein